MINGRTSEEYLHTDVILNRISEYDIFRYYCSNFKELGVKFCSELRKDKHPSVSIVQWNNRLLYKDFGYLDHTFNCFSYVMYKYGLSFIEALTVISNDFNLGLAKKSDNSVRATLQYNQPTLTNRTRSIIKYRSRKWLPRDFMYWKQYGITKDILTIFGVKPIDYFWINDSRFKSHHCSYVFSFDSGHKIYQPLCPDYKWFSNVGKETIQGYDQLPKTGKIIFLTSSLKDVMCLKVIGYEAVALQSEMLFPEEEFIKKTLSRFGKIIVLYDNDYESDNNPGQSMGRRISDYYDIPNLTLPERYGCKDISDMVKSHGLDNAKEFIDNSLREL